MKTFVALVSALLLFHGLAFAQADNRIEDFRTSSSGADILDAEARNARSLASQAYLWGLPAFLNFRQTTEIKQARLAIAPQEEPFGGWVLLRDLATSRERANVMPNVDTLYGAAYIILDKQGPVVISVPAIRDRYYSIALHDAYFNTFAVIGTRTTAGDPTRVLVLPPNFDGPIPEGFGRVIRAPTSTVALFQRIFVRDEADIPVVRALQDEIRLTPLSRWSDTPAPFPKVDTREYDMLRVRDTRDPVRYFEYVSAHTCRNPPSTDYGALVEAFRSAGVGPCSRLEDTVAIRDAVTRGARDAQALIDARLSRPNLRNGWVVPDPNTGRASLDYTNRAIIQLTQVASFPPDEAMYFVGRLDSQNKPLDGSIGYTLTFRPGQRPPVDPRAFWSLTMYDGRTNLLVENSIDRYILRPSTPGLTVEPDGTLRIYLGSRRPDHIPPGNWLPAPNGPFVVTLRTYLPSQALQDGSWFPPALVADVK